MKAAKKRPDYPSTNVSSPSRPPPKKNLHSYRYEDEEEDDEYFEEHHTLTRGMQNRGYDEDDFVVHDDFDEEFAPIRVSKPSRPSKSKSVPAPITVDQRIAGLTTFQKDVLNDFMTGAKDLIKDIKMKRGLRQAPFTDTVLREICLNLPKDEEEMLAIPGINPDMVGLYGRRFLPLVNNTREIFGDQIPVSQHGLSRRHTVTYVDDDDDDQRPMDPNHMNVIDLCDDDSEGEQAPNGMESDYSMGEYEEEGDDATHTSHHFSQQVNPKVEQFNRRFSQAEAEKPNPRPKTPAPNPAAFRAVPKGGAFKKKGAFRRRGSGSFGRGGYSGVSKRGASKAPAAKRSSSFGGAKRALGGAGGRKSGGGGGGGFASRGSILAMPT